MLEITAIRADYGMIPAVRSVSLEIYAGEAIAILGRNGAGKTTTLMALAGMKGLSAGSVSFEGRDITGLTAERRVSLGISLVPEGRGIFPSMTVRENLQVGAYRSRLPPKGVSEKIEAVTERFPRLRERMTQRAGSLSGGEAQMLAVARALMSEPRLLMLDEPSLGLAPAFVQELYELFGQLRTDGLTLIIVEQYAQVALKFVDRAYVLHKGAVALADDASNLRGNDRLLKAYMSDGATKAA